MIAHFKEFLPAKPLSPEGSAVRVFMDAGADFAAVIHGVPNCENPKLAADICREALEQMGPELEAIPLPDILLHLHKKLAASPTMGLRAAMGVVRACGENYDVATVGNVNLIEFDGEFDGNRRGKIYKATSGQLSSALGQNGTPEINAFSVPLQRNGYFILVSDGLSPQQLADTLKGDAPPTTNREWLDAAERSSVDNDWSFIVFPFERLSQHDRSNWPYDPFVGPQEGRDHERRGLAEIADVLFRSGIAPGFRIVGGITPDKARSSYLADGVLIIPEGIIIMELKDHFGRIEVPLESGHEMRIANRSRGYREERNPVAKLKAVTRALQGKNWGGEYPLEAWQKKMAAVIFTNTRGEVIGIDGSGNAREAPLISGEVMVAKTGQFPAVLEKYLSKFKPRCRLKPNEIEAVASKLAKSELEHKYGGEKWSIGRYTFDATSGRETGYYTLYKGQSDKGKEVWLKLYPLKALYRGDRSVAMEALGREVRILQDLPVDQRLERLLDSGEQADAFYTIIEAIDAPDLETWLGGNPSRADRLSFLTDLADLLSLLDDEKVVHRSITPKAILVRKGRPILTGFELAQLDSVATLMVDARRLFDQQYLPLEVFTGGAQGAATDTYSFGALAIRVLSGALPFKDCQELHVRRQRPGYWEKVMLSMGLSSGNLPDVKRIMAADPAGRPIGRELHAIVAKWS